MTDHGQAAIEAAFKKLEPRFLGQPRMRCKEATALAIRAAEPHLRRKWAEEVLKEGILGAGYSVLMNPNRGEHPVTTFTRAVKHMLDLLEGVGE